MIFTTLIREKYEVTAEETVIIGDTEADIHFGKNINSKVCWAEYGFGNKAGCSALKPNYIATSPLEILNFLCP